MDAVAAGASASPAAVLAVASAVLLLASVAVIVFRKKSEPSGKITSAAVQINASATNGHHLEQQEDKPVVRILYGTQTGTAERFSKQLSSELKKRYGDSTIIDIMDIENYKAEDRLAKEKLVLFLMATYGDGEPTDNAADFYNWLTSQADGDNEELLKDVTFGVFGLGNKQYEHFCLVGKKVHKAMLALGAEAMVRRGDGDDDDCIDDDFSAWCEDLYKALSQSALVGAKADANGAVEIPVPAYKVDIIQSKGAGVVPFPSGSGTSAHSPFLATVTKVQELHTPESDRSCVHVELDISGSQASYEAGDHLGIYAQNSAAVVDQVLQLLGHSGSTLVKFSMPEGDSSQLHEPPPGPITLATAVACFADVLSSPHKETLLALATFAADRDEKARLQLLASPEGKQQYADYISKPHRSLVEVLQEFPSAKPSLGAFFGCIAPRLQPRFYSISSSAKQHLGSVHLTCALVRDTTPTGRVHEGVCSTLLAKAAAGSKLPVFLRHSAFKLPASASTPVVMVGPGTGLAPFRGFLQERAALSKAGHQLGDAHLFFGCRSRRQDYIYEQELLGYVAEGVLQHLHVAFSREQACKDYVQHHIERQGDALWAALQQQGGHLYVCGDAKHMARDVHRALIALAQAKLGCSGTQAEGWVKALTDSGRYQRDVW